VLRVTVLKCEDLVPADKSDFGGLTGEFVSSDPYVKLSLRSGAVDSRGREMPEQEFATEVVKASLSPRFRPTAYDFRVDGNSGSRPTLCCRVYDSDSFGHRRVVESDDFLGERAIDLCETFQDPDWSRPYEGQWNLKDPQKKVDPKHRDAKLKGFLKRGLGHIELKLEFIPAASMAGPYGTRQSSPVGRAGSIASSSASYYRPTSGSTTSMSRQASSFSRNARNR
jgi:hypothetical protein